MWEREDAGLGESVVEEHSVEEADRQRLEEEEELRFGERDVLCE